MLVQLNRNETNRTFTPNSTALPVRLLDLNSPRPDRNNLNTQRPNPVVAVLGHPGRVAALPAHLPVGWTMRYPRDLDDVRADEIVLVSGATERVVGTARAVLSVRTRIVALVDEFAPAELVAAVLTAGADVCVRGGQPAILASHLVACRRRQLAERWHNLQDALPGF